MMKRPLAKLVSIVAIAMLAGNTVQPRDQHCVAADFLNYVWQEQPAMDPAGAPVDLRQALVGEVSRMLFLGHLAPMHLVKGIASQQAILPWGNRAGTTGAEWLWVNPGEVVYTLSLAYPFLSGDMKTAVKAYLDEEMRRFPPVKRGAGCWAYPSYTNCLSQGTRREAYDLPDSDFNVWPVPTPPVENLYFLWVYAKNTGDWAYIANNWSDILAVYSDYKALDRTPTYGEIGGLIGMARLAKAQNIPSLADEAASLAAQGMASGVDFDSIVKNANTLNGSLHEEGVFVFVNLTPEVGRYLGDNVQARTKAYLDNLTSIGRMPNWYQSRAESQGGGENEYSSPYVSWPIFMANAYVLRQSQFALRKYLDIPWCAGDLYYIQKLVATMEAPSPSFSVFFPSAVK